jgi:hypothetical protein
MDQLRHRPIAEQRVVDGPVQGISLQAEAASRRSLGVHVDEEHPALGRRQARRQVDGRRGLSDAAFLVRDADDPSHIALRRSVLLDSGVRMVG